MKRLPIGSTLPAKPPGLGQSSSLARALPSSGDSVWRLTPPPAVAPICASSRCRRQRRSPSTAAAGDVVFTLVILEPAGFAPSAEPAALLAAEPFVAVDD